MASNTKLSLEQKHNFKQMKKDYPEVEFVDNAGNLVCAYIREGRNIRFAFAVMSPDKLKFRREVGQYIAMQRVLRDWDNENTILPAGVFEDMRDSMWLHTKDERELSTF